MSLAYICLSLAILLSCPWYHHCLYQANQQHDQNDQNEQRTQETTELIQALRGVSFVNPLYAQRPDLAQKFQGTHERGAPMLNVSYSSAEVYGSRTHQGLR